MNLRSHHLERKTTVHSRGEVSHALSVIHVARAESVVKLAKVTVKVLGVNVNVRALQAPLQLCKIVLAKVRAVGLVGGIDTGLVVYGVVTGHRATSGNVSTVRVSVKSGCRHVHVLTDYISERSGVHPGNDGGASLEALRVDQSNNRRLVGASATTDIVTLTRVMVSGVTTDVDLVNDDVSVKQCSVIVAHGLTNTVKHVPRGAGAESVLALNLTSGNAVLGRAHLKYHHDPRANGNLGGVHHRSRSEERRVGKECR